MFLHCAAIGTKLVNARFYLSKPCLDKIPENGDNNFIFFVFFSTKQHSGTDQFGISITNIDKKAAHIDIIQVCSNPMNL